MCLIDVDKLKKTLNYDANREHSNTDRVQKSKDREHEKQSRELSGSIQEAIGELSGSMGKNDGLPIDNDKLAAKSPKTSENAYLGAISKSDQSYHSHTSSLAARGNE
jgi:hypothetical protein